MEFHRKVHLSEEFLVIFLSLSRDEHCQHSVDVIAIDDTKHPTLFTQLYVQLALQHGHFTNCFKLLFSLLLFSGVARVLSQGAQHAFSRNQAESTEISTLISC